MAGVPAAGPDFAYISCGTWSLVGVELDAPVLTEASRAANFTNEAGVDGTVRYLRNVMGLWLLQECLRAGRIVSLESLLGEAARQPPLRSVVDPDDPVFLPPGDMPGRIAACLAAAARPCRPARPRPCGASWTAWRWPTGARSPRRSRCPAGTSTSCTSSAAGPETSCSASSPPTPAGCRSMAGPAEATGARQRAGPGPGARRRARDLAGMRALVRGAEPLRTFSPAGDGVAWAAAEKRIRP